MGMSCAVFQARRSSMIRDWRGVIEAGQRLVEQKNLRIGDERTRQRGALALPAGNRPGFSRQQMSDPETVGRRGDSFVTLGGVQIRHAVRQVLLHRHVREERQVLKDVADLPALWGDVNALGGIEERRRSDSNLPGIRRQQSCEAAEQRRLAGTRRAKHDRDPLRGVECNVEGELIGEALPNRGGQPGVHDRAGTAQGFRRSAYTDARTANENASRRSAVRLAAAY